VSSTPLLVDSVTKNADVDCPIGVVDLIDAEVVGPLPGPGPGDVDLSFTLTKAQLLGMLAGGGLDGVEHEGDPGAFQRLLSVLETSMPPSRSSRHRSQGRGSTGEGIATEPGRSDKTPRASGPDPF
jgi:hypothetical protein